MLGVYNSNSNSSVAWYAFLTWIIIFVANFASIMVQIGDIPTKVQLWNAFWESIAESLAIYCINKGIQWKRSQETKEA